MRHFINRPYYKFDCIVHDFSIAKLEVCRFTYEALNVMKTTFQIEHIKENE